MEEGQQAYDTDAACEKLLKHWLRMADVWADRAADAENPAEAISWASMDADAFWFATGETSAVSFNAIFERGSFPITTVKGE